jgi:hypothetical protein
VEQRALRRKRGGHNVYQATLTWSVNGIGAVSKSIERQTLTTIGLGGVYVGGQTGGYAGCSNAGDNGLTYLIPGASYRCSGGLAFTTTATMYEIRATSLGIEGRFAATLPGGCREDANFSAVLR